VKKVGFNSYSSQSLFHVANSMYVRNYFDPLSKDATIEMISYIKKAFKEELLDKVKHKMHYKSNLCCLSRWGNLYYHNFNCLTVLSSFST